MTYGKAPNLGFIGRKRTGKDTAAAHLIEEFGYTKHAFADALRESIARVDPVVYPAPGDYDPGTIADLGVMRYSEVVRAYGYEAAKDLFPEFRRILQEFGQGLREKVDESLWVDACLARIRATDGPVVVTDVRYPNEVRALKDLGFVLVKVTRPSVLDPSETHSSEVLTDDLPADYVVENEGPLVALYAFLDGVVLNGAAR